MPRQSTGLLFLFAVLVSAAFCGRSHAQALPAATRSVGFSAFGGYQHVDPDYGQGYDTNHGYFFGVDYTRFFAYHRKDFAASLEGRISLNNGFTVAEKTYLVGLKVEKPYGRLHPYADFLAGPGTIHFNLYPRCCYALGNNSVVYSYGPGFDYDLVRNLQAKFDIQFTHWNFNPQEGFTLTPLQYNIGIKYNIPSHYSR